LNNLIEQGHRFIKRLVKPGMGFFSVETAGRTLQGVNKGDITGQLTFIASLFGMVA
jgi:transposase, IS6 family